MTRITIVDDHILVREGIKTICGKTQDLRINHGFNGWEDFSANLDILEETDLLILDISLARMNGIMILKELKRTLDRVPPVLFLTLHDESDFALSAYHAGAKGYITKDAEAALIIEAIRIIVAGGYYISHEGLQHVIGDEKKKLVSNDSLSALSAQEYEVLKMICEGMTGKEIAYQLQINEKTVGTYKRRVMTKLGLDSTVELVRFGIRNGIIQATM